MRIDFVAFLILTLAICTGTVALQLYLAKQHSRWPGLVLPALTFAVSLAAVMGIGIYIVSPQAVSGAIASAVYMFLIFNIPTVILLIIYKIARNKQARLRDVQRMSLQDLQ